MGACDISALVKFNIFGDGMRFLGVLVIDLKSVGEFRHCEQVHIIT